MNDYDDLYCLSEAVNFLTVILERSHLEMDTLHTVTAAYDLLMQALVAMQTEPEAA